MTLVNADYTDSLVCAIRSNPCKNKGLTVKNEFTGKARSDYSETVKC